MPRADEVGASARLTINHTLGTLKTMSAHSALSRYRGIAGPLWLVTLVSVTACRPSQPSSSVDRQAEGARRSIEQRIADWARWTAAGRIDSITDVFAQDAWEADPNLPPIVGRDAIVEHWRRAMTMGRWQFEPHVEDLISRDSVAMERTSYTLHSTARPGTGGPPSLEDRGSWVTVWRRDKDGQWRILWTIAASARPLDGPG